MNTSRNLITGNDDIDEEDLKKPSDHEKEEIFLRVKLRNFLDKELQAHEPEFPTRLKRLIQIVKICLKRPKILLIDQKALMLKIFEFKDVFNTIKKVLPETTILMIMSTYEDILVTDRCYILDEGEVIEEGFCKDLILNKNSILSQTMIKSDKKDEKRQFF